MWMSGSSGLDVSDTTGVDMSDTTGVDMSGTSGVDMSGTSGVDSASHAHKLTHYGHDMHTNTHTMNE